MNETINEASDNTDCVMEGSGRCQVMKSAIVNTIIQKIATSIVTSRLRAPQRAGRTRADT